MNNFSDFSSNKKISLVAGAVLVISLFLPWISYMMFSESLIGMAGSISDLKQLARSGGESVPDFTFGQNLFVYIGYAYLVLGAAGLYFNYNGDVKKSKMYYYLIPAYFILVFILNVSDIVDALDAYQDMPTEYMPDISLLDLIGIGFYLFVISYIVVMVKLNPEEKTVNEVLEENPES